MSGNTMVNKPKRVASKEPAAQTVRGGTRARKAASTEAPKAEPALESATESVKPNLLRAGLTALGNVRDDVVQQQSRVFEVVLGIDPAGGWAGLIKRDSAAGKVAREALGLRKFEAVFDQRVASALERMGMPSVERLQALTDEVAALKAELEELRPSRRKR